MFDIVITLENKYFLAMINSAENKFITSQDILTFQTPFKKASNEGLSIGEPYIYDRGDRGIFTLCSMFYCSADCMQIDTTLSNFSKLDNTLELAVEEKFKSVNVEIEDYNTSLRSLLQEADSYINSESKYWEENDGPRFPLQNLSYSVKILTNAEKLDVNKLKIENRINKISQPFEEIRLLVPDITSVIRAFSPKLKEDDYMISDVVISQTTSEFAYDDEDEDEEGSESSAEAYYISKYEVLPNFETYIDFKYYVSQLASKPSEYKIIKQAVDSIFYKRNLQMLGIDLGLGDKKLELVIGKPDVAPDIFPNERNLEKLLQVLLRDCMMYELDQFSLNRLGIDEGCRSKLFDTYMQQVVRLIILYNYAYCGKASVDYDMVEDDNNAMGSLLTIGYDKVFKNDFGEWVCDTTEETLITYKNEMTCDADYYVSKYLDNIVNSEAYIEMIIKLMRFGERKSQYICISSLYEPEKPYFDTLKFAIISQPKINKPFKPLKTETGKDYFVSSQIYLNKSISEFDDNKPTVPVGVVLTKQETNGSENRNINIVIDYKSFYSTVFRKIRNQPLYEIEGIDLSKENPVVNGTVLRQLCVKEYSVREIVDLVESSDNELDLYTIEASPDVLRQINSICNDAGFTTNGVNLFKAFNKFEDGEYSYTDVIQPKQLKEEDNKEDYIWKRILKLYLPTICQTANNLSKDRIDYVSFLETQVNKLTSGMGTEDATIFNKLLRSQITRGIYLRNEQGDLIGYLIQVVDKTSKYNLVSAKDELGMRIPVLNQWAGAKAESALSKILQGYKISKDKKQYMEKLQSVGIVLDTDETLEKILNSL